MASIRPFQALRPAADVAARVSSVPYDVVNTEEARAQADGNPLSFLHVTRPEIDLPPATDPHADEVYAQAVRSFEELRRAAPLTLDPEPGYYFYRLRDRRPRADRARGVLLARRVRAGPDQEARAHPARQGGRPHAPHDRPAGPDRGRVPHLSRLGRGRRDRAAGLRIRPALRLHGRGRGGAYGLAGRRR